MQTEIARNYTEEHQDIAARKYAYNFDSILRHYMMQTFKPFLPKGKALELGCYKGDVTELISQHYDDLTVVEAASDLIDVTRARFPKPIKFVCSTFEKYEPTEKFDAIFLIHTLEHLEDPVLVLNKINNWLSPNGILFLMVPNANAPSRQIAVKMGLISHNSAVTEGEFVHGHRCTYSFDTLERDVVKSGLKPIHRGGVFFKALANYQFDRLLTTDIISPEYLDGCYKLGMQYPDLCASIFLLCSKG